MKFFIPLLLSLSLHLAFFLLFSKKETTEPIYKEVQKAKKINLKLHKSNPIQNQVFQDTPLIQRNKDKSNTQSTPLDSSKEKEKSKIAPNIIQNEKNEEIKKEIFQPISNEQSKEKSKEKIKENIKESIKEISPKTQEKLPQNDNITNSYLELYKDDFESFPQETKIYLLKNIKDIGKITQRYLIYPHISIRAKQHGINIVEFILYPDGKITTPKILKSSKYYILDDNSIETIERAYRDYPLPDKATIIRIYVKYELL